MADKQIIIEYCPYFIGGNCQEYLDGVCENHKCDLKIIRELEQKLKDKEQECEAYKMEAEEGKEINAELKAENEELKGVVDENFLHALEEQDRADKYFKTLTEIKEIAENVIKNVSDRCIETTPMYGVHKQILQKINEVKDETINN